MYNPGEIDAGDAYENFMYTEEPVVVGFDYRNSDKTSGNHSNPLNSPSQGQVSLRLPKYSGWFAVCYVRTVTNLVSSGGGQTIQRERKILQCLPLSTCIPSPLSCGDPRVRDGVHRSGVTASRRSRRGAGILTHYKPDKYRVCVEDLRHVQALMATVTIEDDDYIRYRASNDPVSGDILCRVGAGSFRGRLGGRDCSEGAP